MTSAPDNKRIMVCSDCLRAVCYHGDMMCDSARGAGTVIKTVGELRALDLEHSDYWSAETLERIYGDPDPFPVSATPDDGALASTKGERVLTSENGESQ